MENKNIAGKINQSIEDIWIILEKKERAYTADFKLNNRQYVLLTLIIRHPFSTPTELAEKMETTKSSVSQQLAKLEMDGYIFRKQDAGDKRTFFIELGEKGLHYKKQMEAFNREVSEKYHANLSSEELDNMLSVLQKLRDTLE